MGWLKSDMWKAGIALAGLLLLLVLMVWLPASSFGASEGAVVEGLGGDKPEAKAGAAIMLRTFLQPGYEQFYRQAFDLAVAHLRLRKVDASGPKPLSQLWVFLKGNNATPTLSTSMRSSSCT